MLNGLGTVRLADDTRYEGEWRDGQSTGLGVREKPGVDTGRRQFRHGPARRAGRAAHAGRAQLSCRSGDFHADALDGPGVEKVGDGERYEGGFRAGKRHGYGQVTAADGKVTAGRWEDGKRVESAP